MRRHELVTHKNGSFIPASSSFCFFGVFFLISLIQVVDEILSFLFEMVRIKVSAKKNFVRQNMLLLKNVCFTNCWTVFFLNYMHCWALNTLFYNIWTQIQILKEKLKLTILTDSDGWLLYTMRMYVYNAWV